MCGIAGIVMQDGSSPDRGVLASLAAALAHRGPDGTSTLIRGDTGLVHTRLAIIDLSTGDQPLLHETGAALVANGEIYNDLEIRRANPPTAFRTGSDCESPLVLGVGEDCFPANRLRGMYALALHEPERGRLTLSRDPFGIKPLYYLETSHVFAFASEPQAMIAAGLALREARPAALSELLQLKFTTGRETVFPGVFRVLPGETLVVEQGKVVSRFRRDALPPLLRGRRPGTVQDLDIALTDSVAVHLRSDVPYGLFLSGGIDSAAILALMRRLSGNRVVTLTAGWAEPGVTDETEEASRLARVLGADVHPVRFDEASFWALAPRIAACLDDPTADAAALPTWLLAREAADIGLKVALSGEGADELFGGYSRYRKRRIPWRWITRPPRQHGVFPDSPGLDGWAAGIRGAETEAKRPHMTPLQHAQAADCAEWLPNDLLVKLDRTLMAHGVEGRTPFLDPVVASFAFPLPDSRKASLRYGKVLLRAWLAETCPHANAWARKKGFKPPVGRWIARRAGRLAPLLGMHPALQGRLTPTEIASHLTNAERSAQRAWSVLFTALWFSHHLLGVDCSGDVEATLRASASPQPNKSANIPVISTA